MYKTSRFVKQIIFTILTVIPLLFLSGGCGYMNDKPIQNADVYKGEGLETCKINASDLGDIFRKDQREQILCLQQNFIQFARLVRSKEPGSITEAELSLFVKRFFKGQSDAIIQGLSLIFQLNMLLLKDEADRISHSKISPLFELLVKINQEAIIMTDIINQLNKRDGPSGDNINFWELRKRFVQTTERFAASALEIIEKTPGLGKKLNIREFLTNLNTKIGGDRIEKETIDSFIFLKRAFSGGEKEIITSDETKIVIRKLPTLINGLFDIYFSKQIDFQNDAEQIKFYLLSLRELHNTIYFRQPNFELVNSDQLITVISKFNKDINAKAIMPSLEKLKEKIIGGKGDSFTLQDLNTTLHILKDLSEKVYFNYVTYEYPENKKILESPKAILKIEKFSLPEYSIFTPQRIEELHSSFSDTTRLFRYFRNSKTKSPSYHRDFARNQYGLNEVNIMKWGVQKLLRAYGSSEDNENYEIDIPEFQKLLIDAKPLLEEFRLWSPKFQTFARNTIMLADLFQELSNGNQKVDSNEATEYLVMLLTSKELGKLIGQKLTDVCEGGFNPNDPVFDVTCFNEFYFQMFLNKLNYLKSFPQLTKYIHSSHRDEINQFIVGIEGFARDDARPEMPVTPRDATLTLGAMINVESTFLRFDKNQDNLVDYYELLGAFNVYRQTIISLAKLKKDQEKYAKGIFLYMVSKMEIPKMDSWIDNAVFLSFNSCIQTEWCRDTFMDKIEAKRVNIGRLLYYLSETPANVSGPAIK